MIAVLALSVLGQSYTYLSWPKYAGTLENTHLQIMRGDVSKLVVSLCEMKFELLAERGGENV